MPFDLSSTRLVLAGNAYGECSGGGRAGMENVTAIVLKRLRDGWADTAIAVCLAPAQFSCWTDHNRARIEQAATHDPRGWAVALQVADAAIKGNLPIRTGDADSYFALSMRHPPDWTRPPAYHVWSDRWHAFWTVRPARSASNASMEADDLNAAELALIASASA